MTDITQKLPLELLAEILGYASVPDVNFNCDRLVSPARRGSDMRPDPTIVRFRAHRTSGSQTHANPGDARLFHAHERSE
jgi:hypothetical protein